jgi:hypothetical protein
LNQDEIDINKFKDFCAVHSAMESPTHDIYALVMRYMRMSTSRFGSEEHTERKKALMEACSGCTFSDEIDRITNMDSDESPYSRTNYIKMATSVSIDFVDFLCRTPKYLNRIRMKHELHPIMCEVIQDKKLHFELFKHILKCEFDSDPQKEHLSTLFFLDGVVIVSIQNDRIEYFKYIFQEIIPFYSKEKDLIRNLFFLFQGAIQRHKPKPTKCSDYIEKIKTYGIYEFCNLSLRERRMF